MSILFRYEFPRTPGVRSFLIAEGRHSPCPRCDALVMVEFPCLCDLFRKPTTVAQSAERNSPKVEAAGSMPACRAKDKVLS